MDQPPVEADHGGVDVPSEDELEKAKQIVEIFSLPETAALVALRRTRFNLVCISSYALLTSITGGDSK